MAWQTAGFVTANFRISSMDDFFGFANEIGVPNRQTLNDTWADVFRHQGIYRNGRYRNIKTCSSSKEQHDWDDVFKLKRTWQNSIGSVTDFQTCLTKGSGTCDLWPHGFPCAVMSLRRFMEVCGDRDYGSVLLSPLAFWSILSSLTCGLFNVVGTSSNAFSLCFQSDWSSKVKDVIRSLSSYDLPFKVGDWADLSIPVFLWSGWWVQLL